MWAGIGWCATQFRDAAIAYAGKASSANFVVTFLANIKVVWALSVTLSGISIALYLRERRLHRETRERLTARTVLLEKRIDAGRTSSMLTPKGLTRQEDE